MNSYNSCKLGKSLNSDENVRTEFQFCYNKEGSLFESPTTCRACPTLHLKQEMD